MCIVHRTALLVILAAAITASPAGAAEFKDRWSPIPPANASEIPGNTSPAETQPQQQNDRQPQSQSSSGAPANDANNRQESVRGVLIGKASFYAYKGGKTASGTPYNRDALTAASRTLPFGTRLRITDLKTHKNVEVIVTDRGPASKNLILDLSLGAAQKLGGVDRGIIKVRAEIIS